MLNDLRSAFRQLGKNRGFTCVIILTLALGIGASSAIFTAANSVLLRPLPYPNPERLVSLNESFLPDFPAFSIAPGNFSEWVQQADLFESMYAQRQNIANLSTDGEPVSVNCALVTGRFFDTLGVRTALGQGFGPAEDVPGKNDVVVLTHAFWQRQFGGRSDILNSKIHLNGRPYTVIGVMPAWYQRDGQFELYTPSAMDEATLRNRGPRFLDQVIGRLKPGVTLAQARVQLDTIASRLAREYPATNKNWGVSAMPMLEAQTISVRPVFLTLLAAVAALLLIACANIANLVLVRATARQHETTIRSALGANSLHLLRHFMIENILLALIGGSLGLLFAGWGLQALLSIAPSDLPRAGEISLDFRAVTITASLSLLTGVIFGLVPFFHNRSANLVDTMKGSSRIAGDGSARSVFRQGLVVAEIALALILLVGAGLLIRSFGRLVKADPGFKADHALMASVMTPQDKYDSPEKQTAFAEAAARQFSSIPGVTAVGVTRDVPFTGVFGVFQVEVDGRPVPPNERPVSVFYTVNADYFRSMGIPLVRGRGFTSQDSQAPVAIVSQSFAERIFKGQDAIGKRVSLRGGNSWCEIVGIVADIKHNGFDDEPLPQMYEPYAHWPNNSVSFVIRAKGDPSSLAAPLRHELKALDAGQAFSRLEPLSQLVTANSARQQFAMILVGLFAAVALLLAAIGVYGVMSYTVKLRTSEFSIRIALGAQGSDLRRLVLVKGAQLIIPGLVAGTVGAYASARLIQSLLYQTPAHDPLIFAAIVVLLSAIALMACLIPAYRAGKADPMAALRTE